MQQMKFFSYRLLSYTISLGLFTLAYASDIEVKYIKAQKPLNTKSILEAVRSWTNPQAAIYAKFFGVRHAGEVGFPMGGHAPREVCAKLLQWELSQDQALFVRSTRGEAIYQWQVKDRAGSWIVLKGVNPLISEDGKLVVVGMVKKRSGLTIDIVATNSKLEQVKEEDVIGLARSFSQDRIDIAMRTDLFHWHDGCGTLGPHVADMLSTQSSGEMVYATKWCWLKPGDNFCDWTLTPDRAATLLNQVIPKKY